VDSDGPDIALRSVVVPGDIVAPEKGDNALEVLVDAVAQPRKFGMHSETRSARHPMKGTSHRFAGVEVCRGVALLVERNDLVCEFARRGRRVAFASGAELNRCLCVRNPRFHFSRSFFSPAISIRKSRIVCACSRIVCSSTSLRKPVSSSGVTPEPMRPLDLNGKQKRR
jgi:hypothetical protein